MSVLNGILLVAGRFGLSGQTGEWLSDRLQRPWSHGEAHELLIGRAGKNIEGTVEVQAKARERKPDAPDSDGKQASKT